MAYYRKHEDRRWWYFGAIAIVLTVFALVLVLICVPKQQAQLFRGVEHFNVENEARRTLAQIIGGLLVVLSLYSAVRTLRLGQRQLETTRAGQRTDLFVKAIDQLGATGTDGKPSLERRLGAIYALDRISREAEDDYYRWVMELLTAYVRQHAPIVSDKLLSNSVKAVPRMDVQAALRVITLRPIDQLEIEMRKEYQINLAGTDLRGAYLVNAFLQGADLSSADLRYAKVNGADLQAADLRGAQFQRADLSGTHLQGASMIGARLEGAITTGVEGLRLPDEFNWDENVAAASKGARPWATSHAGERYKTENLNDGTLEAWGAAEGTLHDVYAGVILPAPRAIQEMRIWLFSPPPIAPRAHLKDIRVVYADDVGPTGPVWQTVRSRLSGTWSFLEKVTVPKLTDISCVHIEIDQTDLKPHTMWGFACLAESRGDSPNYLLKGSGVYVRELQMK